MSNLRIKIGKIGEAFAVDYLKAQDYQILEQNYRLRFGEIDLIARQGRRTVFVEVKTRRSLKFGTPQTAVTPTKQKQISKVALSYLQEHNLLDGACRFDVIAVFLSLQCKLINLHHIENAFEFRTNA